MWAPPSAENLRTIGAESCWFLCCCQWNKNSQSWWMLTPPQGCWIQDGWLPQQWPPWGKDTDPSLQKTMLYILFISVGHSSQTASTLVFNQRGGSTSEPRGGSAPNSLDSQTKAPPTPFRELFLSMLLWETRSWTLTIEELYGATLETILFETQKNQKKNVSETFCYSRIFFYFLILFFLFQNKKFQFQNWKKIWILSFET